MWNFCNYFVEALMDSAFWIKGLKLKRAYD